MPVAETLQVEEMTTDMLDELLNELTEHGFSENLNEDQKSKLIDQEDQKQTNTDQEGEKYQRYLQEKEDNFKLEQDKITNELFKQSTNNEKNDKVTLLTLTISYYNNFLFLGMSRERYPKKFHLLRDKTMFVSFE